jgi:hypothetical protein
VLCAPARAADPPIKAKAFALVRFKAENLDPKAAVIWRVSPAKDVSRATTPRGVFEFCAPPGTYTVERLTIRTNADGAVEVEEWFQEVEIEKCGCDKVPPVTPPVTPPTPAPKAKADPWNALGRIQFTNAGCTATVIHARRADGKWDVLTAAHCVDHVRIGTVGSMQLRGKSDRFGVKLVALDTKSDCAWLVTESADLGDLPFAYIAAEPAPAGTKIWHGGFGVDNPGNKEEGTVTRPADSNGQTELQLSVSSGDSGGGMFREDTGELISTVCCTTNRGAKARVWGANVDSIRKLRPASGATKEEDIRHEWWTPIEVPDKSARREEWSPVPLPLRKEGARDSGPEWWTPAAIPERSAPIPAVIDLRAGGPCK